MDEFNTNSEPVKKNWQYVVFNIFFAMMYPFLTAFALILTGVISTVSFIFNTLFRIVNFFRKK